MVREKSASCPKCGHSLVFNNYDSINSQEPELKERILDGSLFVKRCEKCGELVVLHYPVLYHDVERGIFVQYAADRDENELIREFKESADLLASRVSYRVVFSLDSFREKVLVFDMGLDDRVLEVLKVIYIEQVFSAYPDMRIDGVYFFSDGVKYGFQFVGSRNLMVEFKREVYERLATELGELREDYFVDYGFALEEFKRLRNRGVA